MNHNFRWSSTVKRKFQAHFEELIAKEPLKTICTPFFKKTHRLSNVLELPFLQSKCDGNFKAPKRSLYQSEIKKLQLFVPLVSIYDFGVCQK